MQLTSPTVIKELLAKYNGQASKLLGQNFLIDQNVLQKIIIAAELTDTDTVLEVGPGLGTLTTELAKKAGKVIAVEKDRRMLQILSETIRDYTNVTLIQEDILKFDPRSELPATYKIIANIPYYLTSPLIRKFLESDKQPEFLLLMIQKEVAERICAKPPEMSLLAVAVQYYAEVKIIQHVSKNSFWPAPKVDSAVIKIIPRRSSSSAGQVPKNTEGFFKVVRAGFSQPRKQLANNLSKTLDKPRAEVEQWLTQNHISPQQRAETLTVQDWIHLTNTQF